MTICGSHTTLTDIMHYMRISDQKDRAFMSARNERRRQEAENDLLTEEVRRLRLENGAREMALIERAIAAGVNPAIFEKLAQSR